MEEYTSNAHVPKVYIPFDDGTAVSFDGSRFIVHKRPVEIDTDLNSIAMGRAEEAWRDYRRDIVNALQTAWRRLEKARERNRMKRIYSAPIRKDRLPGEKV